jgi:hypothetical protein
MSSERSMPFVWLLPSSNTPNKRECEHVVALGSIIGVASPINSPERTFFTISWWNIFVDEQCDGSPSRVLERVGLPI